MKKKMLLLASFGAMFLSAALLVTPSSAKTDYSPLLILFEQDDNGSL